MSNQYPSIPDRIRAAVFPGGRGYETHGVPMEGTPDDPDVEWSYEQPDGRVPVPTPEHADPDPIPVYVVGSAGVKNLKRMRVYRSAVGLGAAQIAGNDDHGARTQTRITNLSTTNGDRLWVASRDNLASSSWGYPVDPGKEIVLSTEGTVYAAADPAAPTVVGGGSIGVAVLTEYETKAPHQ